MPSFKLGNTGITTVKLGSVQVNKIYVGATEVWSSWAPTDADAALFINTVSALPGANLTLTEKQAVDKFMLRIKGLDPAFGNYGNNAIYVAAQGFQINPMVGQTLEAMRVNLMDPLNTTGKKMSYVGGCSIDVGYGVALNGVNGYMLTNINQKAEADINSSSACMGMVHKISTQRSDMGTYGTNWNHNLPTGNDANIHFIAGTKLNTQARSYRYENSGSQVPGIDAKGHHVFNLKDVEYTAKVYTNKVLRITNSTGQARIYWNTNYGLEPSDNIPIGAMSFNNDYNTFGGHLAYPSIIMFSYLFRGLSGNMINYWNDIVEQYCIDTNRKTW